MTRSSFGEYQDYCNANYGPEDEPTREEREGDAWEYWHQRALLAESKLYEIRRALSIHDAYPVFLKWLQGYEDEQEWFGPYKDNISLDGIMTAAQRRAISAALCPDKRSET